MCHKFCGGGEGRAAPFVLFIYFSFSCIFLVLITIPVLINNVLINNKLIKH